jgi:hypothetical protein
VARLELQAPVDPAEAPWPDRENLRGKTQPGAVSSTEGSALSGPAPETRDQRGDSRPGDGEHGDADHGDASRDERGPTDRSRVIRPAGFAGFARLRGPAEPASKTDAETNGETDAEAPRLGGPRDYELDEPREGDLDEDNDRYIPPPLPPQPGLDPVATGAWLALFGGPGYLLVAMLLGWPIAGWAALTAVASFVAGFVVLVFRLGDGPSKRDGPDQGAVV